MLILSKNVHSVAYFNNFLEISKKVQKFINISITNSASFH